MKVSYPVAQVNQGEDIVIVAEGRQVVSMSRVIIVQVQNIGTVLVSFHFV